ncbi:porin [Carnimonas bestiolae]|uniref:porin n=1 Tax=Carnimonas bestiolae TaxID=3402172 RepID=UPI003EDC8E70
MKSTIIRYLPVSAATRGVVMLSALLVGAQTHAFTAFEDEDNKLIISGRIAYVYQWNAGGTSRNEHGNAASRVNIVYERYLGNDVTVLARWEEGFDPFFSTSEGDNHKNRHKYFGISHPTYGTLTVGRQNTVLYDFVDVFTDQPWYYANYSEVVQQGNDFNGVMQRPSDTIKYEVGIDKWSLGALYGWSRGDIKHDTHYSLNEAGDELLEQHYSHGMKRKYIAQVGAQYHATKELTFGAGYHHGRVDAGETAGYDEPNANAWNVGATWTPDHWVFSAVGGKTRNAVGIDKAYDHYAAFGGYTFANALGSWGDINVYYDYNLRKDQHSDDKLERHIVGVGAAIWEGRIDLALDHMWYKDRTRDDQKAPNRHPSTALYARYNY